MPGLTHTGSLSGPLKTQWSLGKDTSPAQLSHRLAAPGICGPLLSRQLVRNATAIEQRLMVVLEVAEQVLEAHPNCSTHSVC
jgi:hypothetical protein